VLRRSPGGGLGADGLSLPQRDVLYCLSHICNPRSMPLCQWKAMAKARKPSGVDAQPMASVGGLKVLLHWAGPDGGEPWVTFNEPSLTAEEICIRIAHKVGESRTSASW
jgi:hypothetical protein